MAVVHARRAHGDEQALVVLLVEERLEAGAALEGAVDEHLLFEVAEGTADEDRTHVPAVQLQLVDDDPAEVLVIDGVVAAEGRAVEVEDGIVVGERLVV